MNKKLIKRVAVASLTALMSIPNMTTMSTRAGIEQERASEGIGSAGSGLYKIVSTVNLGNYTKIIDECDNNALVHTKQWQEYQMMLQQGSPEVVMVFDSMGTEDFYVIGSYQLEGQPEVELPEEKRIKITDPYNCDQLSILKYLGNQLGSQYLFNEAKYNREEEEHNARLRAAAAEAEAKRQAEAIKDQQEQELNRQYNSEMDVYSNNYHKINNSQLPYTVDYFINCYKSELNKSQEKIYASFDNERNYVQQWLDKHNLTLKQLRDMNYTTENLDENVKKYGKQMAQADTYFKWIENGTLPKNCSYGDWIRYMCRPGNKLQGWNWLAIWSEKTDITFMSTHDFSGLATFQDLTKVNQDIANKIIEKDLSVIASYKIISQEERLQIINFLCATMNESIAPKELVQKMCPSYIFREELVNKVMEAWNNKYTSKNN